MVAIRRTYAAVVAVLALASCEKEREEPPASLGRITMHHYFSGTLKGGIDDTVSAFNRSLPGADLVSVPLDHESFKASILDQLNGGHPPDLYSYWAGAKTRAILGDLHPIDDLWIRDDLSEHFPKSLADSACFYDGKPYLLPLTQHLVGFFYNVRLFSEAGIDPPSDWASFLSACAKLKSAGIVPIALGARDKWPAQFWFDYLLLRTAGPSFRDRLVAGKACWTDIETVRAFELWKGLIDAGYFLGKPNELHWDVDAARAVAEGEAAMILMGTWIIGTWKEAHPGFKPVEGYGFFPFPIVAEDVPRCSVGPVDGIVIPKNSGNIAGAEAVLSVFADDEVQKAMSLGSGALAPSATVDPSFYDDMGRAIRAEVLRSDNWSFNYDLAAPPELSSIGLDLFSEFLEYPDSYLQLLESARDRIWGLGE